MNLKPQRMKNESFEKYKQRRSDNNYFLKQFKKGTLVWNPRKHGSYVNPLRQPICCLE